MSLLVHSIYLGLWVLLANFYLLVNSLPVFENELPDFEDSDTKYLEGQYSKNPGQTPATSQNQISSENDSQKPDAWKDALIFSQAENTVHPTNVTQDVDGSGQSPEGSGDDPESSGQEFADDIFLRDTPKLILRTPYEPKLSGHNITLNHSGGPRGTFQLMSPNVSYSNAMAGHDKTLVVSHMETDHLSGASAFNVVTGLAKQRHKRISDLINGDEVITIWINLRTGQLVGSTLNSLGQAKNALVPLLGEQHANYFAKRYAKRPV